MNGLDCVFGQKWCDVLFKCSDRTIEKRNE